MRLNSALPQNLREYVYPGLLVAAGALAIAGVVLLAAAISFEGYISALMVLTLAACSYVGARELKQKEAQANKQTPADYFERKEPTDL